MKDKILYAFLLFTFYSLKAQNLILNPSFSEVNEKKNQNSLYTLRPGNASDVKNWYLPIYINYKKYASDPSELYYSTFYHSSKDSNFIKIKRYMEAESKCLRKIMVMFILE
jgi:hypothetical protein